MLGIILGTVCLIGLIRTLRHGWHGGCRGYAGHYAGNDAGHYPGRRGFGARRWMLRSVLERLDTTPGQEKAIVAAIEELEGNRAVIREEIRQTRGDFGRAMAGGLIDDSTMEETFARHDRLFAQLRVSFVEALRKITEALDERQRKQLAELMESGRGYGRFAWADRYRDAREQSRMWA